MKVNRFILSFSNCSTCLIRSLVAAPYHYRKTSALTGGCASTSAPRRSSKKSRQEHLLIVKAHAERVSHPVPIPEGDWLPHFISWLHANGASGINETGAKLALFEEDATPGSPASRGAVFTEASILAAQTSPLQDLLLVSQPRVL